MTQMSYILRPMYMTSPILKLKLREKSDFRLQIQSLRYAKICNLKSDFSLSFSFNVSGVIYLGCWIYQEVCVQLVCCEMLFPSHSAYVTATRDMNAYFSMTQTCNLKSDFSLSFSFSVSGVIYVGRKIQEVCIISVATL